MVDGKKATDKPPVALSGSFSVPANFQPYRWSQLGWWSMRTCGCQKAPFGTGMALMPCAEHHKKMLTETSQRHSNKSIASIKQPCSCLWVKMGETNVVMPCGDHRNTLLSIQDTDISAEEAK